MVIPRPLYSSPQPTRILLCRSKIFSINVGDNISYSSPLSVSKVLSSIRVFRKKKAERKFIYTNTYMYSSSSSNSDIYLITTAILLPLRFLLRFLLLILLLLLPPRLLRLLLSLLSLSLLLLYHYDCNGNNCF